MIALCKIDHFDRDNFRKAGPPRSPIPPDKPLKLSSEPFPVVELGRQGLPKMNESYQ